MGILQSGTPWTPPGFPDLDVSDGCCVGHIEGRVKFILGKKSQPVITFHEFNDKTFRTRTLEREAQYAQVLLYTAEGVPIIFSVSQAVDA